MKQILKAVDKVTVEEMICRGTYDNYRTGYPNECLRLEEFGIARNGGLGEYVVAHERQYWNINGLEKIYDDERKSWHADGGLDVFSEESPDLSKKVYQLPNVVLTPHIAGVTHAAARGRTSVALENVNRIAKGKEPVYRVNT